MLSIIVAVAKNNVIGKNNTLIWNIPRDLKRFKSITNGNTIIMGRKTFQGLPKILPNRKHIVLSKDINFKINHPMVSIIHNLSSLDPYIKDKEEHFVIGGGAIYSFLLPYTTKMYITKIEKTFQGDTYFPQFNLNNWNLVEKELGILDETNTIPYTYLTYIRK